MRLTATTVVKSSDTSKPNWLRIDHTDEKASEYDSVFLQTYKSYTPANGIPESTKVSLKKQGDTDKEERELVNVPRPMNRENEKIFVLVESTKPGVLPLTTIEFSECLMLPREHGLLYLIPTFLKRQADLHATLFSSFTALKDCLAGQ